MINVTQTLLEVAAADQLPSKPDTLVGHITQGGRVASGKAVEGTHMQHGFMTGWRWRFDPSTGELRWWNFPYVTTPDGEVETDQDAVNRVKTYLKGKTGVEVTRSTSFCPTRGVLRESIEVVSLPPGSRPKLHVAQSDDHDRMDSLKVALNHSGVPKLFAMGNGKIVGVAAYSFQDAHKVTPYLTHQLKGDVFYIHDLGSVGAGAGTALMREAERLAKQKGLPVILAYTASSRPFYQKLGYCCLGGLAWKEANEL